MAKRKMIGSKIKGFRLPLELITKLEKAAALREMDVSEVVREVLQTHIGDFLRQAAGVRQQRLVKAIEAVRGDPAIAALFEKYKDKKNIFLSFNDLSADHVSSLIDALKAYKEVKEELRPRTTTDMPNQSHEDFSVGRKKELAMLTALMEQCPDDGARACFANLSNLLGGSMCLEPPVSSNVRFVFYHLTALKILAKDRSDAAIASVLDLIEKGWLKADGPWEEGITYLSRDAIQTR